MQPRRHSLSTLRRIISAWPPTVKRTRPQRGGRLPTLNEKRRRYTTLELTSRPPVAQP